MSAADILSQPLCALAFCWRIERRDGVTIGLTSHDRPLDVGGLVYEASPGISPSAIARDGRIDAEALDVAGALSSDLISAADLDAGRWDGAGVALHLTEWTAPGVLWLELLRGELGTIEREGETFSASLRGPAALFDRAFAPATSPTCRAELGDKACGVDMAARRRVVRVSGVAGEAVTVAGTLGAGLYPFGRLRWMSGANTGLEQAIVAQAGAVLTLADPPPFAVAAGTMALLAEGCDRRMETCATRFANAANFRGEPYLPGNDLLTRYPGA
jgi:uncharacterized phage protein (TIGR02218 family)